MPSLPAAYRACRSQGNGGFKKTHQRLCPSSTLCPRYTFVGLSSCVTQGQGGVSFPGGPAEFYQNQASDCLQADFTSGCNCSEVNRADRVRRGDQGSWMGNSHWELSRQTVLK